MTGFFTVVSKEFKGFAGSEKGAFAVYGILVTVWSFLLASGDSAAASGPFLFIFFSAIIAANFSNTVFISERMSGSLEILLTSGLSRDAVLFGKMVFIIIVTIIIGVACAALAYVWNSLFAAYYSDLELGLYDLVFYCSATFLNAAGSAYFSVRLNSPRLLHFLNLFVLGVVMIIYSVVSYFWVVEMWALVVMLLIPATVLTLLARKQFAGERIIQPLIL